MVRQMFIADPNAKRKILSSEMLERHTQLMLPQTLAVGNVNDIESIAGKITVNARKAIGVNYAHPHRQARQQRSMTVKIF
ncbi:MAG TPA: hypothetical protein VFW11_01710 [Cyclobacteriaceae bacterium]|nr:hypothetical protein [Cyclobacteriaceae bacterium]